SRAPVLGPWPGRAGQFVANGGFKIGFGMAPKVAEVMADLVLEGRDGVPDGFRVEDCLSPQRRRQALASVPSIPVGRQSATAASRARPLRPAGPTYRPGVAG